MTDKATPKPAGRPNRAERWMRGKFIARWEVSAFHPDGTTERWWVSFLNQNDKATKHLIDRAAPGIDVSLFGMVSEPGCYGHMGFYDREFVVSRIGELGPAEARNKEGST